MEHSRTGGRLSRFNRELVASWRGAGAERSVWFALNVVRMGPALILLILGITLAIAEPVFFSTRNFQNVATQASYIAIVALGQLLVILTRGIDLSVGASLALATIVGGLAMRDYGAGGGFVIVAMIASGLTIGLVNGLIFVKGRVPHPFIVTLAMLNLANGLALVLSDGEPITGLPPAIVTLGSGYVGPIPVPAIVAVGAALVTAFLTQCTQWGRWIYAVGGNPEAAKSVGIPAGRVLISVYAFTGVMVGIGAIIVAGRTNTAYATAGQFLELETIAAVIIGGASFFGGRGSVINAIMGVLILAVLRNGLNLLGVDPFAQSIATGVVVLIAVELDVLRATLEDRFRVIQSEIAARVPE